MKKIAILGSTGSIGTQTLSVVREHGDIEVSDKQPYRIPIQPQHSSSVPEYS